MSRLTIPASLADVSTESAQLLAPVKAQLGLVPNLYRLVAKSTPVLEGWLALSGSLSKGALSPTTRNRIALAVAEVNGCSYCLSAHTFVGKNLQRMSDAELAANRDGASSDPKANAALRFAVKVARERGHISEADLAQVKQAGFDDAAIIEIVMHVALNSFTNYLNEAVKTDIDFPVITARNSPELAHERG